jgi:hypothetical protein
MVGPSRILVLCLAGLMACNGVDDPRDGSKTNKPPEPTETTQGTQGTEVDAVAHAVRASVALRGLRPSADELAMVEADPSSLADLVDAWVASEAFGDTVTDYHAELLLVRADIIEPLPPLGPLEGYNLHEMSASLAEAPLELARAIVMDDRPYTDIVSTDLIRANEVGAKVYGLPYDYEQGGWQDTRWVDGRPNAGVLSSSELWRRHESAGSNHHRARANLISDRFLCADFATRDITVEGGITLSDEFEVAEAVLTDPLCISCHQGLDPLASALFGFKKQIKRRTVSKGYEDNCSALPFGDPLIPYASVEFCYPLQMFNPEDEDQWAYWNLREPGYFGTPVDDLADIGDHIATDPRFGLCAARRWHGYLTQSDPFELPLDEAASLRDTFEATDHSAKALVKAIVLSERFRDAPRQIVRPEQVARQVEHLTGYRWWVNPDLSNCATANELQGSQCWETIDLMANDLYGFRAMAGGINGFQITVPTHTFTPPRELVLERFLADAAGWVVARDFGRPLPVEEGPRHVIDGIAPRREPLLTIDPDATDDASVKQQIADLFLPLMSRTIDADDPEVAAIHALWLDKLDRGATTDEAWALALTALWLDPLALSY